MCEFGVRMPRFICQQPAQNLKNCHHRPSGAMIGTVGTEVVKETFAQALDTFCVGYLR